MRDTPTRVQCSHGNVERGTSQQFQFCSQSLWGVGQVDVAPGSNCSRWQRTRLSGNHDTDRLSCQPHFSAASPLPSDPLIQQSESLAVVKFGWQI